MITKLFKSEDFKEICYDNLDGFELIQKNFIELGDFQVTFEIIFKDLSTNKVYSTKCDQTTTYHECWMFREYEENINGTMMVYCTEVEQVEKTVKVWVPKE